MAQRSEKSQRKAFSLLKLPLTSRLILWYNPKPARMVSIGNAHSSWNANEQHSSAAPAGGYFTFQEEPMPKTKFQNVVFTAIMAICMVYGMIVYNVALNTGGVHAETFVLALHELYIMAPVAFVLEFFVVDGLAHKLAFTFMRPDDRPQFISYAISFCICCVMCPVMSLIATVLFKEQPSFAVWVQTWGMNLPCALLWQLCYCGPFVRLVFRTLFRQK